MTTHDTKRIIVESIPLDSKPHELTVTGPIVHIERSNWSLLVYREECHSLTPRTVTVCAVQPREEIPCDAEHLATSTGAEGFIWHLYALPPATGVEEPESGSEDQ